MKNITILMMGESQLLYYPIALPTSQDRLSDEDAVWATVRNSTTNTIESDTIVQAELQGGLYTINRAIMKWDFAGVTDFTVNTAKLYLKHDVLGGFFSEAYAYKFLNDGALTESDFDQFSTVYSPKGTFTDASTMELVLNGDGITAFQNAITAQGVLTLMLRDYKDVEDIAPLDPDNDTQIDYASSVMLFT